MDERYSTLFALIGASAICLNCNLLIHSVLAIFTKPSIRSFTTGLLHQISIVSPGLSHIYETLKCHSTTHHLMDSVGGLIPIRCLIFGQFSLDAISFSYFSVTTVRPCSEPLISPILSISAGCKRKSVYFVVADKKMNCMLG
jgi:hypothetical protein